ncbi:MAG: hypothetical protein ABJC62_00540 [Frankiaceae bacterium]
MTAELTPTESAVVAEAMKKSGLVWLRVGEARASPVWHLWHENSAYVLHGGDEQPAPGLADAANVAVAVRSKDNGGRLVVWSASVTAVSPDSAEWSTVVPLLAAKRLNAPDGPAAPERWARSCRISRLTPTGALLESWTDPDTGSGAAEAPETPATSWVPLPSWLGRRRPRR